MGETLDLAKLADRDDVKLPDGTSFYLRKQIELGVVQDYELRELIKRVQELDAKDPADKTVEDAEQASRYLRELAGLIVIDGPEKLEDWQCALIFAFWIARNGSDGNPPPQSRRTTGASSRGSKRSTAATRKRGSGSRGGR